MPSPLPEDSRVPHDVFFPDTQFQDLLAVMNACLHSGYDVRRALQIFDEIREQHPGHPQVDARIYNRVVAACLDMAEREPDRAVVWVEDAREFIAVLDAQSDGVAPTATTYALAEQGARCRSLSFIWDVLLTPGCSLFCCVAADIIKADHGI